MIQQIQISYNQFILMAKKTNRNWMWFVGATTLWLGSYFVIRFIFKLENGNAGTFGDQFGAINALFTGLSFAGIIITLRQQQEELSAQRREFMNSRAMTVVYKQIDIIEKSLSQIEFIESDPLLGFVANPENKHYIGVVAIQKSRKLITSENAARELPSFLRLITPVTILTANSVNLLFNLKNLEKMSDEDATLIFQTFKSNIEFELWKSFLFLQAIYKGDTDTENEYIIRILNDIEKFWSYLESMEPKNKN